MEDRLLEIIEKNKIILILTEKEIANELEEALHKKAYHVIIRIRCSETEFVESKSSEKKPICIVNGFGEDGRFENIFIRYGLGAFDGKIIITCRYSLLNHYRDPSLYFVPIKNHRLDKRFFTTYEFQLPNKENIPPVQSTLFLKKENFSKEAKNKSEEKKPKTLREHYLNQKLMTQNVVMMEFLADRVRENKGYKSFLFKLVYASREDEKMQIAAANAITGLNYARVAFSGLDLSRIQIPFADLSESILDETNLSSANLTQVLLHDAWLKQTNLQGSHLDGISFGEVPPIENQKIIKIFDYKNGIKMLISVAYLDHRIAIFFRELESLNLFKSYQLETQLGINSLDINPYAKVAAIIDDQGNAYLWDIKKGKAKQLITEFSIERQETLVDGRTGESIIEKVVENEKNENTCYLSFSPDGTFLISVCSLDNRIILWSSNSGQLRALLLNGHQTSISGISVSPDSELIASSGWWNQVDMTICLWNTKDFSLMHTFNMNYSLSSNLPRDIMVDLLAFSPDSRLLGVVSPCEDSISIYHVKNYHRISELKSKHAGSLTALAFSSDGATLATSGSEKSIILQEIDANDYTLFKETASCINKLIFFEANDNNYLISDDDSNTIHFYIINDRKKKHQNQKNLILLAVTPNVVAVAKKSMKKIELWDMNKNDQVSTLNLEILNKYLGQNYVSNDVVVTALTFSTDNKIVALCYDKIHLALFDVISGKLLAALTPRATPYIHALIFHPDKQLLLSASESFLLQIELLKIDKEASSQEDFLKLLSYGDSNYWSVSLSSDSTKIALGDNLGTVHIFEYDGISAKRKSSFNVAKKPITVCQFTLDNKFLIIGSMAGEIQVWDPITSRRKSFFKEKHLEKIVNISLRSDGKLFASSSADGTVMLWRRNGDIFHYVTTVENQLNDPTYLSWDNNGYLITANILYSIRYWRVIEKENHRFSCQLVKSSFLNFEAQHCNITNVFGLTNNNKEFLEKHGAIDNLDLKNKRVADYLRDSKKVIGFFKEPRPAMSKSNENSEHVQRLNVTTTHGMVQIIHAP